MICELVLGKKKKDFFMSRYLGILIKKENNGKE